MRSRFALIVLLTWAVTIFAQQPSDSLDWNAIHALVGRFNLHDGPNCYNATMIAKGYSHIISQTADEELKYYLWNFCRRVNGPPIVGDILVKTDGREQDLEHAAAYVGNGRIFEKPGFGGMIGSFAQSPPGVFQGDVKSESTYAIRKIEESDYFRKEKEPHRLYRCRPLADIKAKMDVLKRQTEFQIIQTAKQTFSDLAFEPGPIRPENYQQLPSKIEAISTMLNQLSGRQEKDVFLYANAASVWINFANMTTEFTYDYTKSAPMKEEYNRFTASMMSLANRIRVARKGPEISFIMGEPWQLPSLVPEQQKIKR
jgi:hypothetical protein